MNVIRLFVATLLVVLLLVGSVDGGGIVVGFVPGGKSPGEVLTGVPVKGLIAEFLDPGKTGLGRSLAFLLWREMLTSISDQTGAGVIIARTPDTMPLTDMLKKDYHRAAVDIARGQNVRMVMWGSVVESDGKVYLNSYLTLLPEIIGDDLRLNLMDKEGGFREELRNLSAGIPRSRYNFVPVETTRIRLFERPLITFRETTVRERPDRTARELVRIGPGKVLNAVDMDGAWFKVRLEDGRNGWVEISENSTVNVPPREVEGHKREVSISEDAEGKRPGGKVNLDGVYRVLDMRYVTKKGNRYRLDIGGRSAWVDAYLVTQRFSLPMVNFMAGLYRYQSKNMGEAQKAFSAFLSESGDLENNVNRAAGLQLQGGSMLLETPSRKQDALAALDQAVDLTPYDPAAYNWRAIARLGVHERVSPTLEDLGKALELDPRNVDSQSILAALGEWAVGANPEYLSLRESFRLEPLDAEKIRALKKK